MTYPPFRANLNSKPVRGTMGARNFNKKKGSHYDENVYLEGGSPAQAEQQNTIKMTMNSTKLRGSCFVLRTSR